MRSFFRFLSRNKLYTLINIAGLVVSLMFIILMGDNTWRQYSIDSWHKNAELHHFPAHRCRPELVRCF